MHITLQQWLEDYREILVPRWVDAWKQGILHADTDSTQGIPNGHAIDVMLPNVPHNLPEIFGGLYDGIIQATQGNNHTLHEHINTLLPIDHAKRMKLPEVLSVTAHFRQIVWDVLQQHHQQTEQASITDTIHIIQALDQVLERIVQALATSWEQHTEEEIQERISQAEFIAESMASAIEQADRTALQLSSLNMSSQRFASNLENTDQLVEQVGNTLLELIGTAHVSLWLPKETFSEAMQLDEDTIDKKQLNLYAIRCWGIGEHDVTGFHLSPTTHPSDPLRRCYTESTVFLHMSSSIPLSSPWYQPRCGVFVLPLLVKETAIGVVVLQDPDPEERFSRSQQDLARAIINQSAIALENARLYLHIRTFNAELEELVKKRTSELQAEKDRLSTIHEISKEVSSTLDLDMLLNTSLQALARITDVTYGSIMLVEVDTGHLVNRATLGNKEAMNTFTRFPIGTGVAGWVAQYKKPALISNIDADERWVKLPGGDEIFSKQYGSMVAVPLVAHNEILGVLILSHQDVSYFNEDHLRLLTASAGAIAIGINNANMYNTIFAEMEHSSELLHRQQTETSKMEAILQSLSDGVLVCDTYGAILSANPAAGRILKYDIEMFFLGTTLHEILEQLLGERKHDMPLNDLLNKPLDSHQEPRVFETTVEVHMRVISLTLGPVLKDDNELIGALLLMHDISREVQAERLKTEFIGTMSHELRTPMTAIKGFTQLLAMGGLGPVNDTQREFLTTIQNNAERMISMINDVLDITKIETGSIDLELRPLHLAESLSGVISELQTMVQKREHTLTMNIPTGLPLVHADSARLNQILHNLLSNAIKYTRQGGNIWVEAHEVTSEMLPDNIRSIVTGERRFVQTDIRDTGVGIAEQELDFVFDRFYRTENPLKIEAGGTGLGLSLVKPLVEILGGHIWATSRLGEGSTFSFILPAI